MVLDAGLVSRTVGISTASNLAEVVLADFPVEALSVTMALNVAPVLHAPLVEGTVLVAAAGHSAVAQVADVTRRALLVVRAANCFSNARHVGVRAADKRGRAAAHNSVVDHLALGVGAAGGASFTGISTLVANTGEVVQALLIGSTPNLTFVRNADFSLLTFIVSATECIAVLVEAAFPISTVAIRRALHSAPCFNASVVVSTAVSCSAA